MTSSTSRGVTHPATIRSRSSSALGGFLVAYALDLPAGACIVLVSSALVGLVQWRNR